MDFTLQMTNFAGLSGKSSLGARVLLAHDIQLLLRGFQLGFGLLPAPLTSLCFLCERFLCGIHLV